VHLEKGFGGKCERGHEVVEKLIIYAKFFFWKIGQSVSTVADPENDVYHLLRSPPLYNRVSVISNTVLKCLGGVPLIA